MPAQAEVLNNISPISSYSSTIHPIFDVGAEFAYYFATGAAGIMY